MEKQCPICGKTAKCTKGYEEDDRYIAIDGRLMITDYPVHIECKVCGEYNILASLAGKIAKSDFKDRYILSAALRDKNKRGIDVNIEKTEDLISSVIPPDGPLDSIDRILIYIHDTTSSADEYVALDLDYDYPLAFAKNVSEFHYLLSKAIELSLLEKITGKPHYRLTLNGWQRIAELRQQQIKSDQAFVAMWFDKSVDVAWVEGFKPALEITGYKPLRMDLTEHNEKICDRLIAEIRRSALLVADFTGQRGGVYFEAGFAMGLGIPVIWTCRDTDAADLHFDTRQYNHIVWNNHDELKEKLTFRIEATLPRRNKRQD